MGMSTHVIGFRPPDEKWKKHKAIWDACAAAGEQDRRPGCTAGSDGKGPRVVYVAIARETPQDPSEL